MKIQKVLTIGGATQDIFLHYENPELFTQETDIKKRTCLILEEGSKIDVKKISYYTGGGALNSAISFKRLGFETKAFFKIGKDCQGEYILNELKREQLNAKAIQSSDLPTAISLVLPTPSDRIILAYRGVNTTLNDNDISLDLINENDLIYITSLSGESAKILFPITSYAKNNNIKIAVNPGIGQLKKDNVQKFIKSLKNIDILILNAKEAETLILSILTTLIKYEFNKKKEGLENNCPELLKPFIRFQDNLLTIKDYFKIILQLGPSIAVVTNGSEGVYVAQNNKIFFHKSIKPEKIVNTIGAGDSFGSCFVANLLYEKSIQDSLFSGIINASSVISYESATTGLLNLSELEKRQEKLNHLKNIEEFNL